MSSRPRVRAAAAALAATSLLLAGCGSSSDGPSSSSSSSASSSSGVPAATPQATAAGDWLAEQLTDGVIRNDQFATDDLGLSIDVGMALDTIGGYDEPVATVTDAVRTDQASYTTLGDDVYSGATAKALYFLQTQDADPGVLLQQLEDLVVDEGPSTGRIVDDADEDYSNVIGQAYGARALHDAGSEDAAPVAEFLLEQQCDDGWFRAAFASPRASDETCEGDGNSSPDNDTTAIVLLTLGPVADELDGEVDGLSDALDDAAQWLVSQQDADGGLAGEEGPQANANTTGLAGWALGTHGETDAAAAAAGAVEQLQAIDGPEAGAIAYDDATSDVLDGRVPTNQQDQVRRATAQAAPALLWLAG
ncbi:hypothetical protein [uncultured Nocardioides sp.]|uniref:hypothetical protein n=1 Tax=uncultured Nocardioides sp. TaxID=198441 RepID=UPI002603B0CE|nr:hypothetical protein [uncultured Nocardioides sp.]